MTRGVAILVTGMMAQRAFPAVEPAKLQVLIFSGLNNHDWRSTTPAQIEALLPAAGLEKPRTANEPA